MKEKERPGFFGVERSLASTLEEAGKEVDVHSENGLFSRRCQVSGQEEALCGGWPWGSPAVLGQSPHPAF